MKDSTSKMLLQKNDFSPLSRAKPYWVMACLFLLGFLQPYLTHAQTFNGSAVNDTWELRVRDDEGSLSSWSIPFQQLGSSPVVLNCPTNATASSACLTQGQLTAEYNAWLATVSGSGGCNGELTHDGATPPSICSATAVTKTVTFTYTSTCEPFITTCQRTFTVPAYPDFNGPPSSGAIRVCLAQTEQPIPPVISDACGKPIIPTGPVVIDAPNPLTCEGTRTYIFTYTDCAGHSHDWSFVWTLDVPTLSVDAPGTATVSCPSFTPPTYPNTITDACGRPLTVTGPTVTSSPDPITCEGTRTYTWNLTDCAGNTNTWSWIITVERNDFTLPANGGSTVTCPSAANVVPTPPSKMSECGEPIIPTGPTVTATPACEGMKTYTWTYTDCEGNSHDWSYVYTIERNNFTVPANGAATVSCPSDITLPTPPTVMSHCGETITPTGPVITNTPSPLTCEGTRTYAYTYTDCEGNTATWSYVYTIERNDFTVPANGAATVSCPSDITVPTPPTVMSHCGETITPTGPVIVNNPNPLNCAGTRVYTYTYTDCEGNTRDWSFTYTVSPTLPVTITCPSSMTAAACQTQTAVDDAFAAWLATASISGGCDGTISNSATGAPSACGGYETVNFHLQNDCGNRGCQATFTVAAPPPVVLNCPSNQTEAFGQTQTAINAKFAAWLATASGTGGCGGSFTNNATVAPPATGGSVTVRFTKTSTCEPLTTSCQATFTVSSIPPVSLTCPTNATASSACLTQSQLNAEYNAWLATALGTGGCNGALTHDGGTPPTICSATAVTKTVTFTYASTCEPFITTCQRTFTVPAYPTFSVPANGAATVSCPALATPPTPPTVVDGCGNTLTPGGPYIGDNTSSLSCEGIRTYVYTYTDCAGLVRNWSFAYTIERNSFTVPANGAATVACLAAATAPTAPAVTSNCGEPLTPTGPVVTDSPSPLTCEGTRTYAYTYTDCEGNTATWSFTYTIERNPFTVPANGAATVNSLALATAPALPTVMSNCGEVLTPTGPILTGSTNSPLCTGTRIYAYTYTDCEGNTATWSFVYTIIDNAPPTISCSNATVTFSGEANLALNVSNLASAADNCGAPTVTLSTNTVACAQVGQTVMVTATATDAVGLTANCTSQVTVVGLPCGWSQDSDGIGCSGGSNVGYTGGVFTVSSTNCYYVAPYDSDEAGFAQRTLCGNGSITALVTSLNGSGWAGVALRESDAPGARKVQLFTNLSSFSRREVRYTTGGQAYPQQILTQSKYWLRILRQGSQFIGYVSANGSNWSQVFAVTITGLPNCIQAGLVVTNALPNSTVTATFANVSVISNAALTGIETPDSGTETANLNLNLFPNPTSGQVIVDFTPWAGQPALLEVYNLQGRRVHRLQLDEATGPMPVDVSQLPSGVYLFRIGEAQQRVVLQR